MSSSLGDPQAEYGIPKDRAKNCSFQHPWIDSSSQIRLLDVTNAALLSSQIDCTLRIADVACLPDTHYATLSYCWGQARTDRDIHEIRVDGQPFWVRTNLWNFFQSIQALAIPMPIYIDAVCLNQLDNAERGEQVKLMSSVYSNANQTHVWLGTPHPDQDRLVRTLRRQLSGTAMRSSWEIESFVGLSFLVSRTYWQRLWIVQELLLSNVVTLHCGTSTFSWDELVRHTRLPLPKRFFDTPDDAEWWDAWFFPRPEDFSREQAIQDRLFNGWQYALRLFHHRNEWMSRAKSAPFVNGPPSRNQGFPFYRAMPAFMSQQCGDRKDKVYALVGLLDDEGRQMICPNYMSSLQDVFVEAAAALVVSYWRADARSKDLQSLKYDSRIYCDMLNRTLGLPSDDVEIRVSQAMKIAVSYNNSLPNPIPSTAFDSADQTSNGIGYAAQMDVHIESRLPGLDVEPASAESPLRQSLRTFTNELTSTEKQEFAATELKDLKITIAAIQSRQRATGTLQDMTRLRTFLNAVDDYGEMLDDCVGAANTVSLIWGSIRYLLQTAIRRSEAFDGLLSQYEGLGESFPLLIHVKALSSGGQDHQSEIVGVVFRNIFEFHRLALRYFRKPAWQQLFSSTWTQLQTKLNVFLTDIRKHKTLVEDQVSAAETQEARQGREFNRDRFSELLGQARQARTRIEEEFGKLNAEEITRRRLYLFNWLGAPDTMSDHEHLQRSMKSNPTSGQWLLRNARFRAWCDPASMSAPLLWVTGKPGAGKSVLASIIVEEALKLPDTTTLFFYCKHNDTEKSSFLGMARSILHQMLLHDDTLIMHLFDIATKKGETSLRTVKLAREMLTVCLKTLGKTYVIVDGIDECQPSEQQQHIAKFWTNYVESSGLDLQSRRCVLVGQDDATTRPLFCKFPTVRIQGEHHDNDIRSYCIAAADDLQKEFNLTPQEKAQVAFQTSRRAKGMYLLAKLTMHILSQQVTKAELLSEVESDVLPKELNDAYARIMDRILVRAPEPHHKHAKRLLAWTACAGRVLKWREIQAAVSIDLKREMVDFDSHQLTKDSKTLCGALIEEMPNGDVSFVHSTVRPYLFDNGYVQAELEHAAMAELCLSYFNLPAFTMNWTDDEVRNAVLLGTYAFLEYAMVFWTTHLEHLLNLFSGPALPETVTEALRTFFSLHWKEPRKRSKPTKRISELTQRIETMFIYERVKGSMSSMHCLMSTNLSDLEAVQTSDIFATSARVRSAMENMAPQPDSFDILERFYGNSLYKCPRIYCKWFHEGFPNEEDRQSHLDKHERSHYCKSPGCVYATLGCPTAKELAKHVANVHHTGPTEEDFPAIIEESEEPKEDGAVVETSEPTERSINGQRSEPRNPQRATDEEHTEQQRKEPAEPVRRKRQGPSTHDCERCNKRFTRAFGLRSHMKTHAEVLEYKCRECGKEFARQRDCKRHEELHTGERKFVCHGTLRKGSAWGCGRRFARADALGRHFRSEAGRNCIRPLLDEERDTQQNMETMRQQRNTVMGDVQEVPATTLPGIAEMDSFLPDAVKQQLPTFSSMPWEPAGPSHSMD